MSTRSTRRDFLKTAALLGLGDLAFLGRVPPVSAAEAKLDPKLVRLDSGIEPLVLFLEETPRDKLLEEVAGRIKKGLSYREVLTALFLAGVRGIRPEAGHNFHAVLAIHSAHQASLAAADSDRWLPLFWSLDDFKAAQAINLRAGKGWRMGPVEESKLPAARQARQAFLEAMDKWDAAAADVAVTRLARTAGAGELFDLFARYGPRDFYWGIGHQAIFVSNGWRTLQCIGWQHAEPVLRSLAQVLIEHTGPRVAKLDRIDHQLWRRNQELTAQIPAAWQEGKPSPEATADLLAVLRQASPAEASQKVVELLKGGIAPQSIWDGLLVGAAELLMRQQGFASLHAVTGTNALRYAYQASGRDDIRRLLLLQSAAFVPFYLETMRTRGGRVADGRIDQLEPAPLKAPTAEAAGEIFADVSKNRTMAARKVLTYLKDNPRPQSLIDTARLLVFLKGNDSHDYKFSAAVFEDYYHISPAWRDRYLANSMYILRGSADKDNGLVSRTRAALKS